MGILFLPLHLLPPVKYFYLALHARFWEEQMYYILIIHLASIFKNRWVRVNCWASFFRWCWGLKWGLCPWLSSSAFPLATHPTGPPSDTLAGLEVEFLLPYPPECWIIGVHHHVSSKIAILMAQHCRNKTYKFENSASSPWTAVSLRIIRKEYK